MQCSRADKAVGWGMVFMEAGRVSESIQETLLPLKTWLGCHVLPGNLKTPGAEPGLI